MRPDWFNGPVPPFGPLEAEILIVGLAPGLQGANATGRPFTGDWAGDLLYETLAEFGLSRGHYAERVDDGLELVNCRIINAVRCVPPENKPTPAEITMCRQFLTPNITAMPRLKTIIALGRIAHDSVIRALGGRLAHFGFGHGARHDFGALTVIDSYHCSRYNTNTGVLTPPMFKAVFGAAMQALASR